MKRPAIVILVLSLAPILAAQETALTLNQAIEDALARNPDVLAARQEMKAAAAKRLQAEAHPDPVASLATESIPWTFQAKEGRQTEFSLGIEQRFEYPGRRAIRTEIGRLGEDAAALELERVRLIVSARVKRAYYRASLAGEMLAALEPTVETLDRLIENIQVRFQNGGSTYADVLRARIERARLQNRIIEARRERSAAGADLLYQMGRPAGEAIRLATGLACPPLDKTAADVLSSARAARPSLRLATVLSDRAAAAVKLAGLNGKPDLTAGLFVPSKNFESWGFALGIDLPLSEKRRAGERGEAESARASIRIAAEARDKRLAALILRAYGDAKAAGDQVKIFEEKLLGEIQDEFKIAVDYYQFGKMEAYALLDLERSATEARLEYLRALYSYAIALADLEVAGEEEN
jgi:cobalt-zinc-cadmium efflux system outer membrane protein